jgi:glycosyltransferase involved in cell wall biosynthesis
VPKVSVLMPVFNARDYVEEAVQAVLRQTLSDLELLIVDDCSTDGSMEVIQRINDPRIRSFSNEVNQGYLRSTNMLASQASGGYIAFQDADDLSDPFRLERLIETLESDSSLGLCGSAANRLSAGGGVAGILRPITSRVVPAQRLAAESVSHYFPAGSAVVVRAGALAGEPLYRDIFHRLGWEDMDMILRVNDRYAVLCLDEALYGYRANPVSSTASGSARIAAGRDLLLELARQRRTSADRGDWISSGQETRAVAFVATRRRHWESSVYGEYIKVTTQARFRSKARFSSALKLVLRWPTEPLAYKAVLRSLFVPGGVTDQAVQRLQHWWRSMRAA